MRDKLEKYIKTVWESTGQEVTPIDLYHLFGTGLFYNHEVISSVLLPFRLQTFPEIVKDDFKEYERDLDYRQSFLEELLLNPDFWVLLPFFYYDDGVYLGYKFVYYLQKWYIGHKQFLWDYENSITLPLVEEFGVALIRNLAYHLEDINKCVFFFELGDYEKWIFQKNCKKKSTKYIRKRKRTRKK